MSSESKCKKCGALIVWGQFKSGKWNPLDPVPVLGGNIKRFQDGALSVEKPDPAVRLYVSHFSTCPAAKEFRKS